MLEYLPDVLLPVLALVAVLFLLFRLRFFSTRELGGRYLYLFGALMIFAAACWQCVKLIPAYPIWFIPSAYAVLDLVQFGLLGLGVLLIVSGISLYADYWQTRREDIERTRGETDSS